MQGNSRWRALAATLLLGAAVATAAAAVPERPRFAFIDREAGLPSSTVFATAQDHDGYLWIATGDGLARYDGVALQRWDGTAPGTAAVPGSVVQALAVDAADRVWIASEGGALGFVAPGRDRFVAVGEGDGFGGEDVFAIHADGGGSVWIGSFGAGLYRWREGESMRRWGRGQGLPSDIVVALASTGAGELVVGTSAGIAGFDGEAFTPLPLARDGEEPVVYALHVDADGTLWAGSGLGLHAGPPAGPLAPRRGVPHGADPTVIAIHRDRHGDLWLGHRQGLVRRVGDVAEHYREAFAAFPGAAAVTVLGIAADHEGGLWFATRGLGLARLPPTWRNFAVLAERAEALAPAQVRAAAAGPGGEVWLAGDAGLLRLDPDARVPAPVVAADGFQGDRPISVLVAGDGAVWVGRRYGLSRFDPARGTLAHLSADKGLLPGQVDLVAPAEGGSIWASSYGGGVQRVSPALAIERSVAAGGEGGLGAGDSEQLLARPGGGLWVAGGEGLLRWDEASARFEPVAGAPRRRIDAVAVDGDRLWLHLPGEVQRYRIDGEVLRPEALAAAGLPPGSAGALLRDEQGALWLTGAQGLLRIAPDGGQRRYGMADGLPTPEFIDRPALRTPDGRVFAATTRGMVVFHPEALERLEQPPRLALEALTVRRGGRAQRLSPGDGPVALEHDDQELRIDARLLSFADPSGHRYRSRLSGYDADWVEQGGEGSRVLPRLDPGDYRFELVAASADGVWAARPLVLGISVSPPWWREPWALALWVAAALALLAALAAAWRARLRRRHREDLLARERAWAIEASEAKGAFLAHLGHEIRTPMTAVLGLAELIEDEPGPATSRQRAGAIRRAGRLMLRLLNDALDHARIEAGRLELHPAPFAPRQLLDDILALEAPVAARKGLAMPLAVAADVPARVVADARRVEQVLLNLVGNAIKFTESGQVAIGLSRDEGRLVFEVRDTGPGIAEEDLDRLFGRFVQVGEGGRAGGTGLGLAISRELAEAMGGRLEVASEPGRGSRFRLLLPLVEAAEAGAGASPRPVAAGARHGSPAPRRVLLVEDDPDVGPVLREQLEALGHAVVLAPQALAALAEIDAAPFDVALLDLDLPGMGGLELAALLRARAPALRLVAITARSNPGLEREAEAAGFATLARKPLDREALQALLADAPSQSPAP